MGLVWCEGACSSYSHLQLGGFCIALFDPPSFPDNRLADGDMLLPHVLLLPLTDSPEENKAFADANRLLSSLLTAPCRFPQSYPYLSLLILSHP